jgi:hypothetical protein
MAVANPRTQRADKLHQAGGVPGQKWHSRSAATWSVSFDWLGRPPVMHMALKLPDRGPCAMAAKFAEPSVQPAAGQSSSWLGLPAHHARRQQALTKPAFAADGPPIPQA